MEKLPQDSKLAEQEPNRERQRKLQESYEKNISEGRPPYDHTWIESLEELNWVLRTRGWRTQNDWDKPYANLEGARLMGKEADFTGAWLFGANLKNAMFGGSWASSMLESADLSGAIVSSIDFSGASLRRVRMNAETRLGPETGGGSRSVLFDSRTLLADIRWNGVLVHGVDWTRVGRVGEETFARSKYTPDGHLKGPRYRLGEFRDAIRTNRQLSEMLREQGLTREADRFIYHMKVLQRITLFREATFREMKFVRQSKMVQVVELLRQLQSIKWLHKELTNRLALLGVYGASLVLDLVIGYGYRLSRIILTYVVVVLVFAGIYSVIGLPGTHQEPFRRAIDVLWVSITAIHGRVFFESFGLYTKQAWVAAVESVCGIIIESLFVAVLLQRLFSR